MKIKGIIGVILIIMSIAGIVFWECYGREAVSCDKVLTAARDINPGEIVSAEDFTVADIDRDYIISSALGPEMQKSLSGFRTVSPVKTGQQLSADYFSPEPEYIADGESIFVIPSSWLFTKSVLLRTKDLCDIYLMPNEAHIGSYYLAVNSEGIEIACTPEEFFHIFELIQEGDQASLMIVAAEPEWRQAE